MLGDDLVDSEVPCIEQLARVYEEHKCAVVAVMRVPKVEASRYGVVYLEANLAYALKRPELRDAVKALCRRLGAP